MTLKNPGKIPYGVSGILESWPVLDMNSVKKLFHQWQEVSCVGVSDRSSKEEYIEKMEKGLNEKGEVYRRMVQKRERDERG